MLRTILLLFFIQASFIFGQDLQAGEENLAPDSLVVSYHKPTVNELKQILNMEMNYNPYTYYVEKEAGKLFTDVYNPSNYYKPHLQMQKGLNSIDMGRINLKYALQLQPKFLEAGDMGVLGEIFLYMNAAAAGYALYKHFEKYSDEY